MGRPKDTHRAAAASAPLEPVHLPPRDQLPAGITVRSIRVLGTTWYERGTAYWFRRAWMAFCFAIGATLEVVIILGIADAAGNGRMGFGFWAVIAVELVFLVAGYAWMAISFRRVRQKQREANNKHNSRKLDAERLASQTRYLKILARLRGYSLYILVPVVVVSVFFRPLRTIVFGVVALGVVVGFGIVLYMCTLMVRPEFGEEHEARTKLEAQLRSHAATAARSNSQHRS
jgi:Na+/melibiose symporter-like transporter